MNESTAGRSSGQDWRAKAAFLRLQAALWNASADSAQVGYKDFGPAAADLGSRLALHLRECAREAVWTARELDQYAEEEPCLRDVGRTDDDYPPALTIVRAPGDVA